MISKEWILIDVDRDVAAELADECEIPKPIANVLVGRGFDDKEKATVFMEKPPKLIRSPSKLPDCDKAVARLKQAIENKEKIFIWGDYDVDGITSTSVIVTCFEMFGAKFIYKVPNRFDDGYDIKRHSVDECLKEKASLLLSVDCGIVAFDTAEYAKEQNIDVIITDHHSASEDGRIPDCVAVVNPSRIDSEYGFAGLCGATVAFKLMLALGKALNFDLNKIIAETIEYVALGTVADVAPMMDENRVLVHKGCQVLSNSNKPGIQELLKIVGTKDVDTTTIGASQLDAANKRRQSKQEHMYQEAISLVEAEKLHEMPAIVCWAKSWHSGLIGLMAGKLAERYHRPAIVLALNDEGKAKGSCRSTKTVNILKILKHPKALEFYSKKLDGSPIVGGHAFAAGMEVPENNLLSFRQAICEILPELNPEFIAGKKVFIADSRIVPGEINDNTFDSLQGLAPFGSGHPEPVFWVKNLTVQDQKLLSSDKHLKFTLYHERVKYKKFSALLWHKASDYVGDYVDKKIDVLFSFGKENRGFGPKFYLNIIDFRISE